MPAGAGTALPGQARETGGARRAAGLRCPDSVMRQWDWVSTHSVQGMHSRLQGFFKTPSTRA